MLKPTAISWSLSSNVYEAFFAKSYWVFKTLRPYKGWHDSSILAELHLLLGFFFVENMQTLAYSGIQSVPPTSSVVQVKLFITCACWLTDMHNMDIAQEKYTSLSQKCSCSFSGCTRVATEKYKTVKCAESITAFRNWYGTYCVGGC